MMNLNVNSVLSNPISFQHRKVPLKYLPEKYELKDISGNRCACCGNKMIRAKDLSALWDKISAPLSEALKIGKFSNIQKNYPSIYSLLKEYACRYPDETFDKIVQRDENYQDFTHAIVSALPGQNFVEYKRGVHYAIKTLFYDIMSKSRIITKPISDVIESFMPMQKFLDKSGSGVFNELISLAERYPDEQIIPILKKPEVKEKYTLNALQDITELAHQRDYHIEKANDIILDKKPYLREEIKRVRTKINQIYVHGVDPQRVKYEIKTLYEELLKKYNITNLSDAVNSELEQVPGTFYTPNTFLSYAKFKHTDMSIMYHIITPATESEEHINALSTGGELDFNNLIIMCRKCNKYRSDIPYDEFLKYHPEVIENIPKQINLVGRNILNNHISLRLKDYPIKVSQAIYKASNGAINPDIQWYIEKLLKKEAGNEHLKHLNQEPKTLHNHQ